MTSPTAAKRLTYVLNYLSAGDAQHSVHIPNLLAEMEKLGWRIDLVSERGGEGTGEILGMSVSFLSKDGRWARLFPLVRHLLRMRLGGGRLVYVRISKSAAWVSASLGRIFGWKTVFWLSGNVEDFNRRSKRHAWLGFWSMWLLLRLVDRLVTGPETMVDYYARVYRLPKSKIVMLYNDIDLRAVGPRRRAESDELRTLLVHRLSPVRETGRYFPSLLAALGAAAAKTGKTVLLDVCGGGPELEQLKRQAAGAPKSVVVTFHGSVPNRDLDLFYGRATIFVMPSYREGFPRVMLEAMARGLPIVTTDAGGTADLCGTEQRSYVIDRDDSGAFGRAVERLLMSAADQQRLREENLVEVRRFDTPVVAIMYDRALSEMSGAMPAVQNP